MAKRPSPNDQRSNVMNPNNRAYEADRLNRQQQGQGHDNAPAHTPPTHERKRAES